MGLFNLLFPKKDDTPKTGIASMTFKLSGLYYRSEQEKANLPNMKVGKFCVLYRELYNEQDDTAVAIFHNSYQMGYIEKEASKTVSDILNENKHVLCRIEQITLVEHKMPEITLRLFFREPNGKATLPDTSGEKEWSIIDSSKFTGTITADYLAIEETFELVNRNLQWYGYSSLPEEDTELLLRISEDDQYLIRFVNELHRGFIWDKGDRSTFIKECTETREYGNSRILSKRIDHYLDARKIFL